MQKTFVLMCLCTFLSSACGTDPGGAAKRILEDTCQRESQGYLKVVNFKKVDAVSETRNGVDYYLITYQMEVEGVKDGAAPVVEGQDDDKPQTPTPTGIPMVPGHYLNICQRNGKYGAVMSFQIANMPNHGDCFVFNVEKGHVYQVEGLFNQNIKSMTLAKHEQGWVLEHFGR